MENPLSGRNLKNFFNMATVLIWLEFCCPLATGLTEFHLSMWAVLKIFVPHKGGNEL